ncbi:LptF/LptG family permease [Mariniradius sediminis]|uniref:LptF/LptG family permease n=1 Tax=Mariniradius sediminis TaxID=2909237 RepID=A0ABS9BY11_9BACT|nr:LptF/LptG family permease [Mariniradius sediminis]MCF1752632.1 LptF/LptG family permease [Mariniradius sediminis]
MKKIDKLVLGSFIGPFFLTFLVVDFILLTVNMLKYFDEIFGKGLSFWVYMELISYFLISISPMALPLAVLLSSLMAFGNLGEHFELTALKSSGISLVRALQPIGIFVVFLTILAFLSNNYLVPKVNLKTFSLLYDIRMKSPAFDIREGVFYSGIPNYAIKVNQKMDEVRLRDIIIYDHSDGQGNTNIILADSGRMEQFMDERYMSLTLYNGIRYQESRAQRGINEKPVDFSRTKFQENQMIFSLESFQLSRTPEDLWSTNRSIMDISKLKLGLDSMNSEINQIVYYNYLFTESSYPFFTKNRKITPPSDIAERKQRDDSIRAEKAKLMRKTAADSVKSDSLASLLSADSIAGKSDSSQASSNRDSLPSITQTKASVTEGGKDTKADSATGSVSKKLKKEIKLQSIGIDSALAFQDPFAVQPMPSTAKSDSVTVEAKKISEEGRKLSSERKAELDTLIARENYVSRGATVGLNNARSIKNNLNNKMLQVDNLEREFRRFEIAWYQKYTTAFACFVMFLIGAPLGAIIKKGGLGMPVLMSIIFFIIYYMLTITGEKWAKEAITGTIFGTWFSNIVLLPFGLFFLRQARKDARLFEADTYTEFFKKIMGFFNRKSPKTQS